MEHNKKIVTPKYIVNQKVYLNFSRLPMYKAYDTQRGMIYIITHIDKTVFPPLYKLKELDGTPKGNMSFYGSELRSVPDNIDSFPVEKIIKTSKKKGKTKHLVKWLFYPNKLVFYLLKLFFIFLQILLLLLLFI